MESTDELYREIVEQAPDGFIVAGTDGKILLWNHGAEVIFGYSSDQAMITKSFDKAGNQIYVELSFGVLKSSTGSVTGALAIVRDATERYTKQKLQRAELNRLRKQ
jgi:PAS domain-containing protein